MIEVIRALRTLETEFKASPHLFFTEHDLHSRLYHLVQERLFYQRVGTADSATTYLVHHEYPTPFRCDMSDHSFRVASEEERTPRGGKYGRGHYDLVVFNRKVVGRACLEVIRGQDYGKLTGFLPAVIRSTSEPPLLAGVEMVFQRTEFASVEQADRWCETVEQDHEKLQASRTWIAVHELVDNDCGERGATVEVSAGTEIPAFKTRTGVLGALSRIQKRDYPKYQGRLWFGLVPTAALKLPVFLDAVNPIL